MTNSDDQGVDPADSSDGFALLSQVGAAAVNATERTSSVARTCAIGILGTSWILLGSADFSKASSPEDASMRLRISVVLCVLSLGADVLQYVVTTVQSLRFATALEGALQDSRLPVNGRSSSRRLRRLYRNGFSGYIVDRVFGSDVAQNLTRDEIGDRVRQLLGVAQGYGSMELTAQELSRLKTVLASYWMPSRVARSSWLLMTLKLILLSVGFCYFGVFLVDGGWGLLAGIK